MLEVSVLYRHEGRYEEFQGQEITTSDDGNLFLIYNKDGNLAHIIPFDAVASIDIEHNIDEKEEVTNPIDEINNRPGGFAPHSYTLNNYWNKNNG